MPLMYVYECRESLSSCRRPGAFWVYVALWCHAVFHGCKITCFGVCVYCISHDITSTTHMQLYKHLKNSKKCACDLTDRLCFSDRYCFIKTCLFFPGEMTCKCTIIYQKHSHSKQTLIIISTF